MKFREIFVSSKFRLMIFRIIFSPYYKMKIIFPKTSV